ncbi:MAG: hypothetical protein GX564_11520 [Oligosphaeraceae bacterium]|nr:hypothetical protein [Oligosphaeraceae bacterium]
MLSKSIVAVLVVFSVVIAGQVCCGAGFSILEQSTVGLGRSLAGMTAETDDPGSLYFNPATGAAHESPTLMLGTHFIFGDVRFHDRGSTLNGDQSDNITSLALVPNLYYVHPLSDGVTLNLGISATSGTATTYEDDWQGRYFGVETEVSVIEFSPSLSWEINDCWSVGAAFVMQYAEALMTQNIDLRTAGQPDGRIKLEGDSIAFGYSFGVLYQPVAGSKIGLGYRSKLTHDVDMKARYRLPAGTAPFVRVPGDDEASISLNLPASINLGMQQELSAKWSLMFDVSWTQWSDMEELKIEFDNGNTRSETMQWRDNWRFALGTEYKLTDKWTLRGGLAFDQTPVRSKDKRVAKLPDTNRVWASLGAGYQVSEKMRLDFAYTRLFFNRCEIEQRGASGTLEGYYEGGMNLVSLALNYQF